MLARVVPILFRSRRVQRMAGEGGIRSHGGGGGGDRGERCERGKGGGGG